MWGWQLGKGKDVGSKGDVVLLVTLVSWLVGWFDLVCGLWFVVCGLWFVVCGLWFVVCGLWFVVCGLWFGWVGLGWVGWLVGWLVGVVVVVVVVVVVAGNFSNQCWRALVDCYYGSSPKCKGKETERRLSSLPKLRPVQESNITGSKQFIY